MKKKSLLTAYLIWISPLGWLGVHRFYLGKKVSGNFYLATLSLFGIGWIIDGFYISNFVKNYNKAIDENTIDDVTEDIKIKHELKPVPDLLPEWIDPDNTLSVITAYIELILAVALIVITVIVLLILESEELFVFLLLVYMMVSYPKISLFLNKNVIFLEYILNADAIKFVNETEHFYYNKKPKNILLYLFFPITFPFFVFKKENKKEIIAFQKLWIGFAVGFTIFMLVKLSYGGIGLLSLYKNVGIFYLASGSFISIVILLMKSNFRMQVSEFRQVSYANRFLTTLVVIGGFIFVIFPHHKNKNTEIESNIPIEKRIEKFPYMEKLTASVYRYVNENINYKSYTTVDELESAKNIINIMFRKYLKGDDELNLKQEENINPFAEEFHEQVKRLSLSFSSNTDTLNIAIFYKDTSEISQKEQIFYFAHLKIDSVPIASFLLNKYLSVDSADLLINPYLPPIDSSELKVDIDLELDSLKL